MNLKSVVASTNPVFLSLLRIMTGLLLLEHGTAKYLGFPSVQALAGTTPATMGGAAGVIELVGGAMLALGVMARPVAFLLSGTMAVAYFWAHGPRGFFPLLNGGELAISYCFSCLYLAAAGGGPIGIDGMLADASEPA